MSRRMPYPINDGDVEAVRNGRNDVSDNVITHRERSAISSIHKFLAARYSLIFHSLIFPISFVICRVNNNITRRNINLLIILF